MNSNTYTVTVYVGGQQAWQDTTAPKQQRDHALSAIQNPDVDFIDLTWSQHPEVKGYFPKSASSVIIVDNLDGQDTQALLADSPVML